MEKTIESMPPFNSVELAKTRNGLVDYGRFAAALGIVWFHTQAPGNRIAYAALPFFLVLLAMPSRAGLYARAKRLLIPFLQWSVVYTAVNIIFAIRHHEPVFGWWEWNMILTGTSLHLWFLPFAFIASLATPALRQPFLASAAALAAALILSFFGTPAGIPVAQWSLGIIPVLIGFSYFIDGWRTASTALLLCWLIFTIFRPSPDNITILAGTGIALLALSSRITSTIISSWCASLSMWIYLAHPLAIISGQTIGLSGLRLGLFSLAGSLMIATCMELIRGKRLLR